MCVRTYTYIYHIHIYIISFLRILYEIDEQEEEHLGKSVFYFETSYNILIWHAALSCVDCLVWFLWFGKISNEIDGECTKHEFETATHIPQASNSNSVLKGNNCRERKALIINPNMSRGKNNYCKLLSFLYLLPPPSLCDRDPPSPMYLIPINPSSRKNCIYSDPFDTVVCMDPPVDT